MTKVMVLGILMLGSVLNAYPTFGGDLHVFSDMRGTPVEHPLWTKKEPFPIEGESLAIYRAIVGRRRLQTNPLNPIYVVVYVNPGYVDFAFTDGRLGPCATGRHYTCGPLGRLRWSHGKWRIAKRSGF
jgi:hypothetical protein